MNSAGFFFNDDIPVAESQGLMSSGTASSTKNVQRAKKYSTRANKFIHNKNITRNVDYVLKDDINPTSKFPVVRYCPRKHFLVRNIMMQVITWRKMRKRLLVEKLHYKGNV